MSSSPPFHYVVLPPYGPLWPNTAHGSPISLIESVDSDSYRPATLPSSTTSSTEESAASAKVAYTSIFPVRALVDSNQTKVYDSSDHRTLHSAKSRYPKHRASKESRHIPRTTRYQINHITLFNGLPFFSSSGQSWIEEQTGEKINLDQYFTFGPPWQVLPSSSSSGCDLYTTDPQYLALPEKAMVYKLLRWYRSVYIPAFPFVIHPDMFETTVAAAYERELPRSSPDQATAQASIFSFFALIKEIDPDANHRGYRFSSSDYASHAVGLLRQILSAPATIDGLQMTLMLVCCD